MAEFDQLELWGGHECTLNRVHNRQFDQSIRAGHDRRVCDLDRFAALGLTSLRYPILWEGSAYHASAGENWSYTDARLARLQRLKVRPIAGLLHHGSGPLDTNLLDQDFPAGLADHARAVAERYPWIDHWTPINEPLTTARFSALYGHWYPHMADEGRFWQALLNQINGIKLSMIAIRRVNPQARLIQTEDLGETYARPAMQAQADFDNRRRWMTWDLLEGAVTPNHPLWNHMAGFGLGEQLRAIADDPCPPDIIGINHYLTSDRFLDERVENYPPEVIGTNSYGPVADIEAVRVLAPAHGGLENALRATWKRYQVPMAVTEVHNGCTREEQMRWTLEAWNVAKALRAEAIDIHAVTAWALLGAFDWNTLLTREDNSYECGVYDVRSDPPRPTAMVPLLRALANGKTPDHPVLSRPGWWDRPGRILYPPITLPRSQERKISTASPECRPILITGATGTLGRALALECVARDIPHILTDRGRLALDDPASIERVLAELDPWAVVNAAGWVRVDDAELDPAACLAVNRYGALNLASACAHRVIHFATFSSDLVFGGMTKRAYREGDQEAPLNVYGHSKAEADREMLSWSAPPLILRTAAFFSARDRYNFGFQLVDSLRRRAIVEAADCYISPTFIPDLVRAVIDLVIDREIGLWHVVNEGSVTWAEFAREIAAAAHLPEALVREMPTAQMGWRAKRPMIASLASDRGQLLPRLENAIARFASEITRG